MGIALVGTLSRVRPLEPLPRYFARGCFSNRAGRHRVHGEAVYERQSEEAQAAEPHPGCDLGAQRVHPIGLG